MMRRRLALGITASLCGAFIASCGHDEDAPSEAVRGVPLDQRAEPGSVDPVEEANRNARPRPQSGHEDDDEDDGESAEGDAEGLDPQTVTETVVAPVRIRDLSHELRTAFGDPTSCFASLPPTATEVRVTISGTVLADGYVITASARSSVDDANIRQCLRSMTSGLRIEGDVPGAPRSVSATLVIAR